MQPASRALVTLATAVTISGLAAGCQSRPPVVVLENPPTWPTKWSNRRLYRTPDAYIYASSASAAGEADRWVQSLAHEFAAQTGGEPDIPLVLVVDVGDAPLIENPDERIRVVARSSERDGYDVPATDHGSSQSRSALPEDAQERAALDTALTMMPLRLSQTDLRSVLDFPDGTIQAGDEAITVPTSALVRRSSAALLRAALADSDVDALTALALAPIMPWAESATAAAMLAARDAALFGHYVTAQRDWSEQDKLARIHAYQKRKVNMTVDVRAVPESTGRPPG